jgi:hypothetical protein
MNFNEAKDYLYNRYKGNFTVSTDNVNFFSNGFYAMTFGEYGLYICSFSVLENGQPVWSSNVNDLTIKKHFSDDTIKEKLKKIEKYIDDELLALNEIKKNLLKTKVDQL